MIRRRQSYRRSTRDFVTFVKLRRMGMSPLLAFFLSDYSNLHMTEKKLSWWADEGDIQAGLALNMLVAAVSSQ